MAHPNLLFLYTDEQRYDTLAAYGNERIDMPNLNRLAERATVLERAYVTQPVCTPSRSSLLTGLWPHTSGCTANNIALPPDTPCLPEMLPAGLYRCAHHGKWHLGDEVFAQHGFDEWRATDDTYHRWYGPGRDQAVRSSYHRFLLANGIQPEPNDLPPEIGWRFFRKQIAALPEPVSRPAYLAGEAGRFIGENRRRPWVLYVNFLEPHMPFHSCRDGQYDPAEVELPGNFDHELGDGAPLKARLKAARYRAKGFEGQPLVTEEDWRRLIARYWGMCSLVDTHVGRILAALEETGQADRTIVVFTSDHGDMMGSHRLLAKGVMFEESVRVPLVVRLPGRTAGRRVAGPVSQIDLVPTLLELMGQAIPAGRQGRSIADLLAGGRVAGDGEVVIEWNADPAGEDGPKVAEYAQGLCTPQQAAVAEADPVRTIVTPDGWKFNCSPLGEHELYNLSADPLERRNLAGDAGQLARMNDLLGRICAWQTRSGDVARLPGRIAIT